MAEMRDKIVSEDIPTLFKDLLQTEMENIKTVVKTDVVDQIPDISMLTSIRGMMVDINGVRDLIT